MLQIIYADPDFHPAGCGKWVKHSKEGSKRWVILNPSAYIFNLTWMKGLFLHIGLRDFHLLRVWFHPWPIPLCFCFGFVDGKPFFRIQRRPLKLKPLGGWFHRRGYTLTPTSAPSPRRSS